MRFLICNDVLSAAPRQIFFLNLAFFCFILLYVSVLCGFFYWYFLPLLHVSQKGFVFKENIIEARTPHDAVCTLYLLSTPVYVLSTPVYVLSTSLYVLNTLCTIAEVVFDTNSGLQMTFSYVELIRICNLIITYQ